MRMPPEIIVKIMTEVLRVAGNSRIGINQNTPLSTLHISGAHTLAKGMMYLVSTDHAFTGWQSASGNYDCGFLWNHGTVPVWIMKNNGADDSLLMQSRIPGDATVFSAKQTTGEINIPNKLRVGDSTVPTSVLEVNGAVKLGDGGATNYLSIGANGDVGFAGTSGFYPRVMNQSAEPAAGTGATELDTGELCVWTDSDDSKCYLCYNHSGTVKTIELI